MYIRATDQNYITMFIYESDKKSNCKTNNTEIILLFIFIPLLLAAQQPDENRFPADWLPQTYTTYHWVNTDPGGWQEDYQYRYYYTTDGLPSCYYQIKAETGDTLFRVTIDYTTNNIASKQVRTTTYQYTGEGQYSPVSMHIETQNIYEDVMEDALYIWHSDYAWIQQNGIKKDYIYNNDGQYIRILTQEYNNEINCYENSERQVFYYNLKGLETWLKQLWDKNTESWKNHDRIDAKYGTQTPDTLIYRTFLDSVWKVQSVKGGIIWKSYTNYITNYKFASYDILYLINNQLTPYYRYTYDYLNNGGSIKTGYRYTSGEPEYMSRSTKTFNSYDQPLEIHSESWNQQWETTYWQRNTYTYDGDKLKDQISENFNTEYNYWEPLTRVEYREYSMTSIVENSKSGVQLFPNPAIDKINLVFPLNNQIIDYYEIYRSSGLKQISRGTVATTGACEILVNDLQPGLYILHVQCGSPTFTQYRFKFIKR